MATIVDSYSESNQSGAAGDSTTIKFGQSFTGSNAFITSAKFNLRTNSGATGTLRAYLYTISGTYGVNSTPDTLLATSDAVDVSTIGTDTVLVEFTFSGTEQYKMGNEYYFITMEGSATGTVWFGQDASSPTHSGNYWSRWGARSDIDVCFYVYGEEESTPIVGEKYPLPPFRRSV